jgi:hypothetical protein
MVAAPRHVRAVVVVVAVPLADDARGPPVASFVAAAASVRG